MLLGGFFRKDPPPCKVLPFDRQQMADYLNLDRSALSKELGKMKDEGIIRFRKNRFEVCARSVMS